MTNHHTAHLGTLFIGAALLFWIQPLAAKTLLPSLGGAAFVWNTALVYFQFVLLCGYGLAHLLATYTGRRLQLAVLTLLWTCTALTAWFHGGGLLSNLPAPSLDTETGILTPSLWLLKTFFIRITAPCLAIATLTPLLSAWYVHRHPGANPYTLYAVSNSGAVGILLAYPFFIEPLYNLPSQQVLWLVIFFAVLPMLYFIGLTKPRSTQAIPATMPHPAPPERFQPLRVFALALIPNSLLLATTQQLTNHLPTVPFLWILPLLIFLATFIYAFLPANPYTRHRDALTQNLLPFLLVLFALLYTWSTHQLPSQFANLTLFALIATCAHGELARLKPMPSRLTAYYLVIAASGFVATSTLTFTAPIIFNNLYEYPYLIAAAALLTSPLKTARLKKAARSFFTPALATTTAAVLLVLIHTGLPPFTTQFGPLPGFPQFTGTLFIFAVIIGTVPFIKKFQAHPPLLALVLCLFLTIPIISTAMDPSTIRQLRTSFGTYTVRDTHPKEGGRLRSFYHGAILHGAEWTQPNGRILSKTVYYSNYNPYGDLYTHLARAYPDKTLHHGFAGLGIGSLLCHIKTQDTAVAYEIDPAVYRLATTLFKTPGICASQTRIAIGDARLGIQLEADHTFDTINLDAFSSATIPVHLLTVDAFAVYLQKLKPQGLLSVHISNRNLDLHILMANTAHYLKLHGLISTPAQTQDNPGLKEPSFQPATVVVLAPSRKTLDNLGLPVSRWEPLNKYHTQTRPWRDSYTSLLPYLHLPTPRTENTKQPAD